MTTYNWYFSNAGDDTTGDGSSGDPWETLAKAQTEINSANSDDVINFYFNRGDTWTSVVNTAAVQKTVNTFGFIVLVTDPTVHMDAYGTGSNPKFDGQVTDFSTVPDHDSGTGPLQWTKMFAFKKSNCSISNIELTGMYGDGIHIKDAGADGFGLYDSDINMIGKTGLEADSSNSAYHIKNNIAENCILHTTQQLYLYGKRSGWGPAIDFTDGTAQCYDNTIRYCLIYDSAGEGVTATNGLMEYNVFGDCISIAINGATHGQDAGSLIIRYNFIIHKDWTDTIYTGGGTGIRIFDERSQSLLGDNTGADFEVYGNIIINKGIGIKCYADIDRDPSHHYGLVKIYNNIIIDSHTGNFYTGQFPSEFDEVHIYNNSSILYDQVGAYHAGGQVDAGWTIDNNHFWTTGGSPTVASGWQTNMVTTDPKLPGEDIHAIDWDGQSGATYYKDIDFDTHLYPPADSGLIGTGKTLGVGYENTFLTQGTDFGDLPDTETFEFADQPTNWDIGAIVRSDAASPYTRFRGINRPKPQYNQIGSRFR